MPNWLLKVITAIFFRKLQLLKTSPVLVFSWSFQLFPSKFCAVLRRQSLESNFQNDHFLSSSWKVVRDPFEPIYQKKRRKKFICYVILSLVTFSEKHFDKAIAKFLGKLFILFTARFETRKVRKWNEGSFWSLDRKKRKCWDWIGIWFLSFYQENTRSSACSKYWRLSISTVVVIAFFDHRGINPTRIFNIYPNWNLTQNEIYEKDDTYFYILLEIFSGRGVHFKVEF